MASVMPVLLCAASLFAQQRQSPVEMYGKLRVDGTKIVSESGEDTVQLMGMSLYWSVWGGEEFYNRDVVSWLVEDWNIDVIRASMSVDEGGWIRNPEGQTALVDSVIAAAVDNGIYVIVDWHTHYLYTDEAIEFFGMMAEKYADCPNIIWETYNEPTTVVDEEGADRLMWDDLVPYHEDVISAIREHSDNLVLAGTPQWSQRVDMASRNPLSDENTAYVLHFYAGTHEDELMGYAETAMENGAAIFISEWGTTSADGGNKDPEVYTDQSDVWIQWAIDNNISMLNWSVHRISEASAALNRSASYEGGWNLETDLSESGLYIRDWIKSINDAKYGEGPVSLRVTVDGPGSYEISPQKEEYVKGDTVTLTATAGDDARFMFWAGSVSDTNETVTFVMNTPKRLTANFYDFTAPLVKNGDFSDTSENWSAYVHSRGDTGASATVDFSDNQARVEIERPGDTYWHVQFFQGGITLLNKYDYELTFEAAADEPRDITVFMKQNGGEYTEFYGDTISLTDEMQTCTLQFSMIDPTEVDSRIEFNFGEFSDVAVTVKNVDLKLLGEMPIKMPYGVRSRRNSLLKINGAGRTQLVNISFQTKTDQDAVLKIMDLNGRTLERVAKKGIGKHNHIFDGRKVSAGVYLVVLETAGTISSQKIMLTK